MIKWKGRDLKELGIIVEKIPTISKAKKKIDIIQIEGRNGFITIDTGVYEPFAVTLECHCTTEANLDEIKCFLDGYGILCFDNLKQYTAVIDNTIPFETILPIFKKFQISFIVNPIAEDINETTISLINQGTINIETYSTIYPILEITCTGDVSITINNNTFYLNDTSGTYTLDSKNQVIVDEIGNNVSGLMMGDFPTFKNGENTISYTGNITVFNAEYRKTYL